MFTLAKIINGRVNVSEPRTITVTAISNAIAAGTPVNINGGVVTPLTAASTVLATHVVDAAAEKNATELHVIDLLPGMVFEAPLNAATTAVLPACKEYLVTADGVTPTAISSSLRGAVTYDAVPASAAGAKIYVTFPNA